MGPVLVGLDGSRESIAALRWGEWFAARTQQDLHVAHAWQHGKKIEPLFSPANDVEALESGIQARLREMVEAQFEDATRVTGYLALRGEIAGSLLKEAARAECSLIVVGARGAGGALRVLLGSVSRQLTECPARAVAIVPDGVQVASSEGWVVVVGVDGSAGSSRALRWAGDVARRGGGEVLAVHAFEPPEPDLSPSEQASVIDETHHRLDEEWCAPLRRLGVAHQAVIERGEPCAVLRGAAERVRPACVVVGSRGLGAFSQRLLGSVTYAVVRELDWPTVVIPSTRDCPVWKL